MNEIELTKQDYIEIRDYAHKLYIAKSLFNKNRYFNTECITQSVLVFCQKKCYNIIDGKIYKQN